jgi:hypothetical protein
MGPDFLFSTNLIDNHSVRFFLRDTFEESDNLLVRRGGLGDPRRPGSHPRNIRLP